MPHPIWGVSLTVEGTISEQDFARLNWSLFYRKPPIALLIVTVLCIGLFYSTRTGLQGAGAVLPWSPLLVPLGLYFMVTHNAKRRYRASKTLQSRLRYTPAAEGIRVGSNGSEAVLTWDQFGHWADSRRFLMLYSVKGQVFLVDKSWFGGDNAAMLRFTEALDKHQALAPVPEPETASAAASADVEDA
jgi:hypothetical protein